MSLDIPTFLDGADLVGVGEPAHGEPAFAQLRNHLLTGRYGFRSVAIESDRVAGLLADEFAQGGDVPLERALTEGFSHGFGALPANRDLLMILRAHNAGRPAAERVRFYGFDASTEMFSAPSPRAYLEEVHRYLNGTAEPEWRGLLGADERWSATEAIMDPAASVGRSADAAALRVIADDLLVRLHAAAPAAGEEGKQAAGEEEKEDEKRAAGQQTWHAAEAQAMAALGLLRYHAQAAEDLPMAERIERLSSVRAVLMAQHLLIIRRIEASRGPTLVFAHNAHLQRHGSGAGAIISAMAGQRYRYVAASLGASPALDLPAPDPATVEARLGDEVRIVPAADLPAGTAREGRQNYFPLDDAITHGDAVLHVPTGVSPEVLAERVDRLPDVAHQVVDDSWFFFVGPDRRQPFATIVQADVPDFDEASALHRPGVFRINVELGRTEFERRFGFPPKDFEDHRAEFDFARCDVLFPHPGYALYGWASIVCPGPHLLPELEALLQHAHARGADRDERSRRRTGAEESPAPDVAEESPAQDEADESPR